MAIYAVIGSAALVVVALIVWGIWYARQRGVSEGQSSLDVQKQKERADAAEKAAAVLAEHRTDSDVSNSLRSGKF